MKKNALIILAFLLTIGFAYSQATGFPIANKPLGGSIGTAATTVDKYTIFNINQTTASQILTIPKLTNAVAGKIIYINNTGTVLFNLFPYGDIDTTAGMILRWEGLRWSLCGKGTTASGINPTSGYLPVNTSGTSTDSYLSQDATYLYLANNKTFSSINLRANLSLGTGSAAKLAWSHVESGYVTINNTNLSANHTAYIELDAPYLKFTQYTPSPLLYIDSSNNIVPSLLSQIADTVISNEYFKFKKYNISVSDTVLVADSGIVKYKILSPTDTSSLSDRIDLKADITGGTMLQGAGVYVLPSRVDNGNGTVTLGSGQYAFDTIADGTGPAFRYTIAGSTYSFTDSVTNYVVANYNGGSPTITVVTSTSTINNTTTVPILTVFRIGTHLDMLSWGEPAKASDGKMLRRMVRTERFAREPGGLEIGVNYGRGVTSTAGVVWNGLHQNTLAAFNTHISTDSFRLYSHVASVFTKSNITQFNNTQYDDGTALQTLTNNHYAVNWIFRTVNDNQAEMLSVLGTGDYTLAEAEASLVPSVLPAEINATSILIGRIIVKKSDTTATLIQSEFEHHFGSELPSDHATLSNLSWTSSGHTDGVNSIAGFNGSGTATIFTKSTVAQINAGSPGDTTSFMTPARLKASQYSNWSKEFIFDGQGSVIATGQYISKNVDRNVSITGWKIFEESATPVSSTIDVSLWKDTYANYPPTSADTVNYWQRPTLTAETKNQVTFATPIIATKGDEIVPYINNNTGAIRIKIVLIGIIEN